VSDWAGGWAVYLNGVPLQSSAITCKNFHSPILVTLYYYPNNQATVQLSSATLKECHGT